MKKRKIKNNRCCFNNLETNRINCLKESKDGDISYRNIEIREKSSISTPKSAWFAKSV